MTDPNQEKKWFIAFTDHHEGPFTPQEIRQRIQQRTVESNPYIWCEGIPNWIRLQDSGLKLQPTPPPLPSLAARGPRPAFAPMPQRRMPAAAESSNRLVQAAPVVSDSLPEAAGAEPFQAESPFQESPFQESHFQDSPFENSAYQETPFQDPGHDEAGDAARVESPVEEHPLEQAPRESTNPALRMLREKAAARTGAGPVSATHRSKYGQDLSGLIEINSEERSQFSSGEALHSEGQPEKALKKPVDPEAELLAERARNQARMRIWLFCILVLALACIGLIFLRFGG